MQHISKKPLNVALGAALALVGMTAQASVFQSAELGHGYMVASADEAKAKEHSCGEAKCGANKGKHKGMEKKAEGSCGEKKKAEGSCGEKKGAMPATPATPAEPEHK